MNSNNQLNLNKVSLKDRFVMVWYWMLSHKRKYYINGSSLKLSEYNSVWNLLRTCEFKKPEHYSLKYFIGGIMFEFDGDHDFRYMKIGGVNTDLPRSLCVLVKKKQVEFEKEATINNKLDPLDTVIDAYTGSKGL